jgi:putative SOS response-associated peptidase YedK
VGTRALLGDDAFYKWQKIDARTKQPFAIAMKDRQPYAFAGLWEKWKDRRADFDMLTFTVITTDPNELVEPMHDRMPVIIPAKDYDRWLKATLDRPPIDLLRPFDAMKNDSVAGGQGCRKPEERQARTDGAVNLFGTV